MIEKRSKNFSNFNSSCYENVLLISFQFLIVVVFGAITSVAVPPPGYDGGGHGGHGGHGGDFGGSGPGGGEGIGPLSGGFLDHIGGASGGGGGGGHGGGGHGGYDYTPAHQEEHHHHHHEEPKWLVVV